MQAADFCVIGAGIVGLATARELLSRYPAATLILVEKEPAIAQHQSGRNSGVIHAGVYYPTGSLKARLCREGNLATKNYCREQGIPFRECGKLIVATNDAETARLVELRRNAGANAIETEWLEPVEIQRLEPLIVGSSALLVPDSAIVDYRLVCASLARQIRATGATVRLSTCVTSIDETDGTVRIGLAGGDCINAGTLIACCGLQADRVARLAGLTPPLRIVPFRGAFHRLAPRIAHRIHHLVYPVPDPTLPFLGIHLTPTMDGLVTVGPNAVLSLARERYGRKAFDFRDALEIIAAPDVWRLAFRHRNAGLRELAGVLSRALYLRDVRRYCPDISASDLSWHPPGIRAQAVGPGGLLESDFLIEATRRSIHVLNAPSPAATSALPIARQIADWVADAQAGKLPTKASLS